MQSHFTFLRTWTAVVTVLAPLCVCGQALEDSQWNHFGVDYRLGFNIKARFSNIGAFAAQPPSLAGNADHTYADGFVRVDSSGDRGGMTWNWGYHNAAQLSGKETIEMHSISAEGAASTADNPPRLAFEASYARDMAHLGWLNWGFKLALGFTDVKIRDSQALVGNISLVTDAYSLGGITPPLAPYSGSFTGPGPVISDTPTRTLGTVIGGAQISGNRQLDVWLYDLRFGPYLELPLGRRLKLQAGGGLAFGLADSTFSFSDTTTTSLTTAHAAGTDQSTDSLIGFYGEAGIAFRALTELSLFAGGQFQYLGEFTQHSGGRSAQLDLRDSIYLVLGIQWHF